jgi:hypothetical protein
VSPVTPLTSKPRAVSACRGPFASCSTLCRASFASHPASTRSPSGSRSVKSMNAAVPSAAASATACASPVPAPHEPWTWTPVTAVACSSSQAASAVPLGRATTTSKPPSASGSGVDKLANNLSRSTRNSRESKSLCTSSRSQGTAASSSTVSGSSRSHTSSFRRRFLITWSRWSRRLCPALPATWSTFATIPSRPSNWLIHFAAVFGPTPGTPGRLSLDSPTSAARSGYRAGRTPYLASTASGVIRARSLTPLRGYSTVADSPTSWKASRSPVQISTSIP